MVVFITIVFVLMVLFTLLLAYCGLEASKEVDRMAEKKFREMRKKYKDPSNLSVTQAREYLEDWIELDEMWNH